MREASLFVLSGVVLWAGAALVLSTVRWFARVPLSVRLAPYLLDASEVPDRSFHDLLEPIGARMAAAFGVSEALALRLERIHSPFDVATFRVRQVGWAVAGLGFAGVVVGLLRPAPLLALFLLASGPLLAVLWQEQRVVAASDRWRRRVFLELPVVAEQLAMLLSAGYSLGSALGRLAERGRGCCGADLRRVVLRMRQGLSEADALREWAVVARVDALDRLVPVLALNREATDLGRLLSAEARAIRKDVQRELVETMERRSQAVWVPVTVATLVPGVIFLAIPFIEALRLFSGS